jgi:hypothetical protein
MTQFNEPLWVGIDLDDVVRHMDEEDQRSRARRAASRRISPRRRSVFGPPPDLALVTPDAGGPAEFDFALLP